MVQSTRITTTPTVVLLLGLAVLLLSSTTTAFVAPLPRRPAAALYRPAARALTPRAPRAMTTTARHFKNFDEMLEQLEVPVLVDFYAQWCGPCVMMQPVLEDVAGRLENVAKVAKVDTDKSPRLGSRYQVEALPTLILFYKGQVIDKYIGYRNADDLEKEVRASMARIPGLPK